MAQLQSHQQTTAHKALTVNLDLARYGAFAEIGAGQEVARHFFQAGRASQTIAKTISAYDMVYSDEIYGKEKNGRYVCESRLNKMLDKEFSLLLRRLDAHRGDKTCFFAFANTVATGTAESPRCHGWMGIRFQNEIHGEANDVVLHIRMMDRHRLQQQETLGVLGVNLVHSAFYHSQDLNQFLTHLVDNIKSGQLMIDAIKFQGPHFKNFDTRLANLELVNRGLAEVVLFSPQLEVLTVGDVVYDKAVILQRGSFRPVTNTHIDVLEKGVQQFKQRLKSSSTKSSEIVPLMEITAHKEKMNAQDFLTRIESLASLGHTTLVSRFNLFYELKSFFRKFTQNEFAIVMSALHLEKIMDESHYQHLEGGIFEGLGKLFDPKSSLFIYPHKTDKICMTARTFNPSGNSLPLYRHFSEKQQITDILGCDEAGIYHHSDDIQKLLKKKDSSWEKLVPTEVKKKIIAEKIFGYR